MPKDAKLLDVNKILSSFGVVVEIFNFIETQNATYTQTLSSLGIVDEIFNFIEIVFQKLFY